MKKASIFPSRNLRFIRLRIDEYSKRVATSEEAITLFANLYLTN